MSEKTITITKDQFVKAVSDASENFVSGMESVSGGEMSAVELSMMNLQNIMFGAEIAKVLFKKESEEEN